MEAARGIVREAALANSTEVLGGDAFAPVSVIQSWSTEAVTHSGPRHEVRLSSREGTGRGLHALKNYHDNNCRLAGADDNGLVAAVSLPILRGSEAQEYITDALAQGLEDAWIATDPGGAEVIALCTRPKTCPESADYNPPLSESIVYFMNHAPKVGKGRANMEVNWKRGFNPNVVEVSLRVRASN